MGLLTRSAPAPALQPLGLAIEEQLVAGNRRGMAQLRRHYSGYLLPAVDTLLAHRQRVAIVSGFPVAQQFETDGPGGALVLARALAGLGAEVCLLGADDYIERLEPARRQLQIDAAVCGFRRAALAAQLAQFAAHFRPTLLVFIEVPGHSADGCYYNMRFQDISARTLPWEQLQERVACPSIALADGGNELGMGRLGAALADLNIAAAVSLSDQLVLADVSNWGVYGLLALASARLQCDLLRDCRPAAVLDALCAAGFVDGVTGLAEATEDGLPAAVGAALVQSLRRLYAPHLDGACEVIV